MERAVHEVNRVFRSTVDCPGHDISIDEGMGAASSSFNPCFIRIENKPLEGIRFFIAVDFVSKCSVGIIADLKQFSANNSVGHPGGFVGKIVVCLLNLMALPGIWYRF